MDQTKAQEIDQYVSRVIERFNTLSNFIKLLPVMTLQFWGNDFIDRMPQEKRKKLNDLLQQNRDLQSQVDDCLSKIIERQSEAIQRAGDLEMAGITTPAEAIPLFLIIHGLFDESMRLASLAMQSSDMGKDIVHLFESVGDEMNNSAGFAMLSKQIAEFRTDMLEKHDIAQKDRDQKNEVKDVDALQATLKRFLRQHDALDKWALPSECADVVGDMIEKPGYNKDTLRRKIQDILKRKNCGKIDCGGTGIFYRIADIADAVVESYPRLTVAQCIKEFEPFACTSDDPHRRKVQ